MTTNGRELIGPGLTLHRSSRCGSARGHGEPKGSAADLVQRLDEMTASAMRIRAGVAMLVRPDAAPGGQWTADAEPRPALEAVRAEAARRIGRAA
jgi:hypothetical protein